MRIKTSLKHLLLLSCMSLLIWSCTEDKLTGSINKGGRKITGSIRNESGDGIENAIVQLKIAQYNPITRSIECYDNENSNCQELKNEAEILEYKTTTDKSGNYIFMNIPSGQYTLCAKDANNQKAVYHPNLNIDSGDVVIGPDTLVDYMEISIHIPNSIVTENCFLYIPGTDIFFQITKAGTMTIQIPMGYLHLVFMDNTNSLLESLFLIVQNLFISDTMNNIIINDTITNDTLINDTIINDTIINDTIINDTIINDTVINDDTLINDTIINDTVITSNCDQVVVVSSEQYANAPAHQLTINHLEITDKCLIINFISGGSNGDTWELKLIDAQEILESMPPQRNLRLSLKNEELGKALITKEISFDINELQINDGNSILLNITNSNDQILYEY